MPAQRLKVETAEVVGTPLSNFSVTQFHHAGLWWKTAEHAFQAAKTLDKLWYKRIVDAHTPAEAKRLGRLVPLRADWEGVKEAVMLDILRAKYRDDEYMRRVLLNTGDLPIRESAVWDSYWGTGRDGKGKNRLGVLLMQVRRELLDQGDE